MKKKMVVSDHEKMDGYPSIFDCEEYLKHGYPPYMHSYHVELHYSTPVLFSFAYTPSGRVSKFWCSYSFGATHPTDKTVERWMNARPKLRKGYRWSEPYWYTKPQWLIEKERSKGKVN